jgi:hypothetical protein
MSHRWLPLALIVLVVAATTTVSASAQPIVGGDVGAVIRDANALSARIRSYHRGPGRWTGITPPPPDYCSTMRAGEAVVKELAHLASKALLARQPGLALSLQAAANRLSDELDEEEEINNAAEIPYQIFPCPAPSAYPARAVVLGFIERRMPRCRAEADALGLTFQARRTRMQQCLRLRS